MKMTAAASRSWSRSQSQSRRRTRRRRKEEWHDTQTVVVLPVGRSINHKFQTITAGGREEEDDNREGGRGEGGSDRRGGRIAFDHTTMTIAAVSSTGCHAPLHLCLIPHPLFQLSCAYHHPCPPPSPAVTTTTITTKTSDYNGKIGRIDKRMLHPDATYEKRYGDAYFDGAVKYLYRVGYQSMRPRSGLWRLSMLMFVAFAILNVFVVGHCYDRGVRKY